jgi:hypothetical protein
MSSGYEVLILEWFPSRTLARQREKELISVLTPKLNIDGVQNYQALKHSLRL